MITFKALKNHEPNCMRYKISLAKNVPPTIPEELRITIPTFYIKQMTFSYRAPKILLIYDLIFYLL